VIGGGCDRRLTTLGDRTAWLSMQSEAKRSRGPLLPAICDLQGDFQKLQGEPVLRYEFHQFLQ
jgi:hypothetical protein